MAGRGEQYQRARAAVFGFRGMARDLLQTARAEQLQGNHTALADARQLLRQELQAPDYQAQSRVYRQERETIRRESLSYSQRLAEDVIRQYQTADQSEQRSGLVSALVTNTSHELFTQHFDDIGSVLERLKEAGQDDLFQRIGRRLVTTVEREAANLTTHQLAKVTEWYANSQHASEPAREMLRKYFHSTEQPSQKDPYHNIAGKKSAVKDKAIEAKLEELSPKQSRIIPIQVDHTEANAYEKAIERGKRQARESKELLAMRLSEELRDMPVPRLKVSKKEAQEREKLRRRRMDLMKRYALSTIELANNPALKKAALIGSGLDPYILPVLSGIFSDYMIAANLEIGFLYPQEFQDPENLPANPKLNLARQEAMSIRSDGAQTQKLFRGIRRLTQSDYTPEQSDMMSDRLTELDYIYTGELMAQGWPLENAEAAIDHVVNLSKNRFEMITYSRWLEMMQNSIFRVIHNPDNQLIRQYNVTFEPEVAALVWKEKTLELPELAQKAMTEVVVPVAQMNDQMHLLLEQYDPRRLSQIMDVVYEDVARQRTEMHGEEDGFPDNLRPSVGILALDGKIHLDSQDIFYFLREQSPREEEYHPLAGLQRIGFPLIESPDRPLREVNEAIRRHILIHQSHLIDYKGYRFPLDKSLLGQYGYTHVDVFSDENPWYTIVRFNIGEQTHYEVKINQLLQFMPEGKRMPTEDFMQFVEHTVLSLLSPVLSEKPIGESGARTIRRRVRPSPNDESTSEIVTRATQGMGYLRTLPINPYSATGAREEASDEAAELFKAASGRNLRSFNEMRINARPPLPPKTYVSPPDAAKEANKRERGKNPRIVNIAAAVIG